MKKYTRILIGAGCVVLLLFSWIIAISSKSDSEKQLELIRQATGLTDDGIHILAVPLLEEAAGYDTTHTLTAETKLKSAYLELVHNMGFSRKYVELLEKQMNRKNASADIFKEAADYYLSMSKIPDALTVLKTGITKTGDAELITMYENNRYAYSMSRTSYDYVAAIFGDTVQVQIDGLWGLARADGTALITCEYEKISTFSKDRAIVKKNDEIYAIDSNNNRVAKLHEEASDIGNFAYDRVPLLINDQWQRATGGFELGTVKFQNVGMYSGGYIAAKADGKWGVIDLVEQWLIPAEYDGMIQDELGRCYAQDAVFARQGGEVYLLVGGNQVVDVYEDARPFSDEGFAAVKRNGKWGFIDTDGTEMIGFTFDDALSFGQHLAAVKIGELWGYVSMSGSLVIEPVFLEAKSFSNGIAPVLTERGWQFITLLEYKE
jgi:hypothetical protein